MGEEATRDNNFIYSKAFDLAYLALNLASPQVTLSTSLFARQQKRYVEVVLMKSRYIVIPKEK